MNLEDEIYESPRFACPQCGGEYFGRDSERVDGRIFFLRTVRCHDQFNSGCQWRGEWPPEQQHQEAEASDGR